MPAEGLLCDLMWSDPAKDEDASSTKWQFNESRECSYLFGHGPTKELLKRNDLLTIFRGHQVVTDGYKMHKWGK